ncbi:uncharacterized protein LOC133910774 [Phragmites australis]|uniref:uncharacterized protein LOC133910774 n=1 Tax=Phragmites australis TaxID=29695 RepID=UPI002D7921D5|nr:uncharacterized protein LOC133910774 [Phragmites australis]
MWQGDWRLQDDWTADDQRSGRGTERAEASREDEPEEEEEDDGVADGSDAVAQGVAALGLGTYGAHMFRPKNPAYKEVWHTASLYHLVHTAALLGAPITKRPNVFGGLLSAGIVLFSGTCYTVAYLKDRKFSSLAPLGGFAFIAAWASLLL